MEGKPHKLLESVAEDIAGTVLQDYENVLGIKIKIQKPHVAIEGVVKYLGEAPLCVRMLFGDFTLACCGGCMQAIQMQNVQHARNLATMGYGGFDVGCSPFSCRC